MCTFSTIDDEELETNLRGVALERSFHEQRSAAQAIKGAPIGPGLGLPRRLERRFFWPHRAPASARAGAAARGAA